MSRAQKRPHKVVLKLADPARLGKISFYETIGARRSIYKDILNQSLQTDRPVEISVEDKYALTQLKQAAKLMKLRLVFGKDETYLYVKPLVIEGELQRLYLLLREPRTLSELQAKHLELNLKDTLENLIGSDQAKVVNGKYALTEKGLRLIAKG